ncbi:MAG: hypothetical protein WD490_01705 [Opitutales bacterium]
MKTTRGLSFVTGGLFLFLLFFRVSADRAGSLIDQSIAEGANRVERLAFTATQEQIEEARQRAMPRQPMWNPANTV